MDNTAALIATLDAQTQRLAIEYVNRIRSAHELPLVITSARRSDAEQSRLVAQGLSKTLQSKHVVGRAFDVDMYGWNRDRVPRWVWDEIGPVGEQLGFKWGGRWGWDWGHFEL
jgi:hypothetical protein